MIFRLFKKSNTNPPQKTNKMMEEDMFWQIIQDSLKGDNANQVEQEKYLVSVLKKMNPQEMIGFRLRTDQLLCDSYNDGLWCAGYLMSNGCSDDGFQYFRCWIISRGKDVYTNALRNPDSLICEVRENGLYDFESFWYVALEAFTQTTGLDLYEYISDDFKMNENNYPEITFCWSEKEPETMKNMCPRLFARHSHIRRQSSYKDKRVENLVKTNVLPTENRTPCL